MNKPTWLHLLVVLLITLGAAPPDQKSPGAAKVLITTRLDKTALWVGDILSYRIQVIHNNDLQFVLDNLKKEKLPLAPFDVRGVTIQQGDWTQNKKLLEITLRLSSYETGRTDLTIPSFNLYYFQPEVVTKGGDAVAEAVQVPATTVGLRSTLRGSQFELRDFKPISKTDLRRGLGALFIGLIGMAFVGLRTMRWTWANIQSGAQPRRRLGSRALRELAEENMGRIRTIGGETPENLNLFYTEVSHFLRQYLSQGLEIEAEGLTPEEIGMALEQANVAGPFAQEIRDVLEQCDAVRYRKDGPGLGVGLHNQVLQTMESIVGSITARTQ